MYFLYYVQFDFFLHMSLLNMFSLSCWFLNIRSTVIAVVLMSLSIYSILLSVLGPFLLIDFSHYGLYFFSFFMPVKFNLDVRHCDLLGLDILYF